MVLECPRGASNSSSDREVPADRRTVIAEERARRGIHQPHEPERLGDVGGDAPPRLKDCHGPAASLREVRCDGVAADGHPSSDHGRHGWSRRAAAVGVAWRWGGADMQA